MERARFCVCLLLCIGMAGCSDEMTPVTTVPGSVPVPGANTIAYGAFTYWYPQTSDQIGIFTINSAGVCNHIAPGPLTGEPSWSWDKKWLVFSMSPRSDIPSYRLWKMNFDGSGKKPLAPACGFIPEPSISPDGEHIVFRARTYTPVDTLYNTNLIMIDSAGGHWRALIDTATSPFKAPYEWDFNSPSWASDGNRIAFVYRRTERPPLREYSVCILDLAAHTFTDVPGADSLTPEAGVQWSPVRDELIVWGAGRGLHRLNIDGSNVVHLSDGFNGDWSADGERIVYASMRNGNTWGEIISIWTMNRDGSNQTLAIKPGPNVTLHSPSW